MVRWIIDCNRLGFRAPKLRVCDAVQTLLNLGQQDSKFTNNRPGRH